MSVRSFRRPVWEHTFVPRRVRFTEQELRWAIACSVSWSEALRRLGYRSAGGNWLTLKRYAARWSIDTSHFDPDAGRFRIASVRPPSKPLAEVLVEESTYSRKHLKERLYREGLKQPRCEMCGQGDRWNGQPMALILDHINGVPNDNRLGNLRIVCPNCAATLKTHCGAKNKKPKVSRRCRRCGQPYYPKRTEQRYCSRECGQRYSRSLGVQHRVVERPPYQELIAEIAENGFLATGRKHGVSDNAVRKWVRFYEADHAVEVESRRGDDVIEGEAA